MAKLVLSDLGTISSIAAGFSHTCAVKTDGTTHCWGSDSSDSAPTTSPNPSRVPMDLGIISTIEGGYWNATVGASHSHTCGIKDNGKIQCWGHDFYGQSTVPAEFQ